MAGWPPLRFGRASLVRIAAGASLGASAVVAPQLLRRRRRRLTGERGEAVTQLVLLTPVLLVLVMTVVQVSLLWHAAHLADARGRPGGSDRCPARRRGTRWRGGSDIVRLVGRRPSGGTAHRLARGAVGGVGHRRRRGASPVAAVPIDGATHLRRAGRAVPAGTIPMSEPPNGGARFRSARRPAHIQACKANDFGSPAPCGRGDGGSVALELVLLTPVVLVLIVFVVFCGRTSRAESLVRDAAAAGARAASLRQQPSTARTDALAAVQASLAGHSTTCSAPQVSVDTTALRPGGQVLVRVSCTTRLGDLALLGIPGSRTFTATSVEVVDRWRGG